MTPGLITLRITPTLSSTGDLWSGGVVSVDRKAPARLFSLLKKQGFPGLADNQTGLMQDCLGISTCHLGALFNEEMSHDQQSL